ncbi:MAG: hypothetical protein MZV64_26920 [Ignavibacteriales bacterium]|nr:hypothetical protein [Ignavibacteriales bacterium]
MTVESVKAQMFNNPAFSVFNNPNNAKMGYGSPIPAQPSNEYDTYSNTNFKPTPVGEVNPPPINNFDPTA